MNRNFLVTKFACSRCGSLLSLNYDKPPLGSKYAEGEPTGAAILEQVVSIDPCKCVTNQLEDIRAAACTLLKVAREDNAKAPRDLGDN